MAKIDDLKVNIVVHKIVYILPFIKYQSVKDVSIVTFFGLPIWAKTGNEIAILGVFYKRLAHG